MPKYKEIEQLSEEQFRRLTGVKKGTFEEMVDILTRVEKEAENKRYRRTGRKSHLSIESKILMTLEYIREYRTYFHLGNSYGVSESTCYKICRSVEEALIKSGKFSLPGKKELLKSEAEYEVILIDATETAIQRPKKK